MSWFATRHDDYVPPIAARDGQHVVRLPCTVVVLDLVEQGGDVTAADRRELAIPPGRQDVHVDRPLDLTSARTRKLTDNEIRVLWKLAAANGTFGALVRPLLLTGQRREKVVTMRWQDIANGVWTIPAEAREKGNAVELVLPELALDILRAQPRFGDNPYVLAGRGNGHITGYSKGKRALDEKLAAELPDMPQWQLHDLRRTARSLMPRAGVPREQGERVLGHALEGVEGVYDVREYREEKAEALRRLAARIDDIVHPRPATVVPMARPPKRRR
jgi:integrase